MSAGPTAAARTARALELCRRLYVRTAGTRPQAPVPRLEGQAASDAIRDVVAGSDPAMIARLGSVELDCLLNHEAIQAVGSRLRKAAAFVAGRSGPFWWADSTLTSMVRNAGFFPPDPLLLERFAERMLDDMLSLDVLGSWLPGEERFRERLSGAVTVRLRDLEPYYHELPWTEALAGQTVLVVHPFADTIRRQYERRELLFDNPRVLPEFELKTLKAVQSGAGAEVPFSDWFEALESMADAVAAVEFDVALLGCGAYGFPLAAHVKRLGRRAVHLGGACQILFGIRGRRWDTHEVIAGLYNEHWVRPGEDERPPGYLSVEAGCYW